MTDRLLDSIVSRDDSEWRRELSALVAKYSYGLQLWQAPALWVDFGVIQPPNLAVGFAIVTTVLIPLVWGGYMFVEHPAMQLGGRLTDRLTASKSGAKL